MFSPITGHGLCYAIAIDMLCLFSAMVLGALPCFVFMLLMGSSLVVNLSLVMLMPVPHALLRLWVHT